MTDILRFPFAVRRDAAIESWLDTHHGDLGSLARTWFQRMRDRGDDVRELLHDGCPVACVGDAAFGYVNVFTAHMNVGFFRGAFLDDPVGLLQGTGKCMRHIKLRAEIAPDHVALEQLIEEAYAEMQRHLEMKTIHDDPQTS